MGVVDDLLREHLLPNEQLVDSEVEHAGILRMIAAGRYGAKVQVDERTFLEFDLIEGPHGEERFTVTDHRGYTPEVKAWLLLLAWHRAAEAMLAVRRGHEEYNIRRTKRKDKLESAA